MASEAAGQHKDPVTGELISKTCVRIIMPCLHPADKKWDRLSELKRRIKEREREAKKAEKVAAQPQTASASRPARPNESDLNPNVRPLIYHSQYMC